MKPDEIRAARGALSRAAFARHLGVTSLTVLRWELPAGNKEARRPRPKMLELLRKLAAEGVGRGEPSVGEAEDEEDDASEPRAPSSAPPSAPVSEEELRVAALLAKLQTPSWERAEQLLLGQLASGALTKLETRVMATLGLAQAQLMARGDVRGALATLLPILAEAQREALPRAAAARAHVLAAQLFAGPDSRVFDPGRAHAHASAAERLLDDDDDDAHIMLVVARTSAARLVGPPAQLRAYTAGKERLLRAQSPLARLLSTELHAMRARLSGDAVGLPQLESEALEQADRLGYASIVMVVFAYRAHFALHRAQLPADVLALVRRARAAAPRVQPGEPLLRVFAAECEALARLGRFAEAEAVYREGLASARQNALPLFAFVPVAARLFLVLNRVDELEALAERLREDADEGEPEQRTRLRELHVLLLQAVAACTRDPAHCASLAAALCAGINACESTVAEYIAHDAPLIALFSSLLAGDLVKAQSAVAACETLYAKAPSLWHVAVLRRMQARLASLAGHFAEASHKLSAALSTFELLGDVVQQAQCRMDIALVAQIVGAPDAATQLVAAEAEFARLGIPRLPITQGLARELLMSAPESRVWKPETLIERTASALERLSAQGLPRELLLRELQAVLRDLFPGESTVVAASTASRQVAASTAQLPAAQGEWCEIDDDATGRVRFGVEGRTSTEARAVLRALATVARLALRASAGLPGVAAAAEFDPDPDLPGFVAVAASTRALKREIAQLARSRATVLISGESGSGKEVVARAVHDLSTRAAKPYVAFNCAAVPRELFEGQLFGYRKGAFTGAVSDNLGVLRSADGGSVFLDEVGELPLDIQPKLLRFLENGEIFALGEQKPRKLDVRVLAATHRDLPRLVREGLFREDLYYRLNVVPLQVPPLRERPEDVVALARLFAARLSTAAEEPPELGPSALAALKAYSWPGNVRELRNVIERAMAYEPVPALLLAEHLRLPSYNAR